MLPDWMNVLSIHLYISYICEYSTEVGICLCVLMFLLPKERSGSGTQCVCSTCILFLGDHKIMSTLGMNMNGVGVESFSSAVW